MPNILICNRSREESEFLGNKALSYYSQEIGSVIIFETGEALLSYLEERIPEPNILVVELGFCKDVLKTANKAKEINPWTEIIFLCNNGEWNLEVYEVDHVYGLACPYSDEKLEAALKRAMGKIGENHKTLLPVKKKGIIYPINIREIQYIENDRRTINIYTEGQCHSLYLKFSEIEKYKTDYFVRCHNSYAVNLFYVRAMEDFNFVMNCGKNIPISRSRRMEAREAYEVFITRETFIVNN